jgi:hypothetical protein
MKKNYFGWIITLSTFISVVTMLSYSGYVISEYQYEKVEILKQAVAESNSRLVPSKNTSKYMENKEVKENYSVKEYLNEEDLSQNEIGGDSQSEDNNSGDLVINSPNVDATSVDSSNVDMAKTNNRIYIYNGLYGPQKSDRLDDYDYEDKENEQSVFKVSTSKIVENLTNADKIKLLYISIKLGKEDYKKVEKYLYAENAEDGVIKALKFLKESLSEKEYEKVRGIAGRFIDMEAAEMLY